MAIEITERPATNPEVRDFETEEVQIKLPAPKRNVCWFLTEVKALIAKPGRWIQGKSHRRRHDAYWPDEYDAYCVTGAFDTVTIITRVPLLRDEAQRLFAKAVGISADRIVMWNDTGGRTHRQVLAAFDAAIVLAEREGACEP